MNLIYIGNRATGLGKSPSVQDELTPLFAEEHNIQSVSNKKNKVLRMLHMVFTLLKYGSKTDVVLIDTFATTNFYFAFVCGMYSKLARIPFVLFLHGGSLPGRFTSTPKMSKMLFSSASRLVSPSNYLRTAFLQHGYSPILIPNILHLPKYPFKQRAEITSLNLLWVRNFRSHYNPELAIQITEQLVKSGKNCRLEMVGPGGKDESLANCKKLSNALGLQNEIRFVGLLSKAEWIDLSKNCNVFINTTNVDNTPVSVIEAMALGLPVVTTNVGGIPYLLEDGVDALLVPPNDVAAMTAAILRLVNEPGLAERITFNARKKVEQFDWDIVKHKWNTLFNELAVK